MFQKCSLNLKLIKKLLVCVAIISWVVTTEASIRVIRKSRQSFKEYSKTLFVSAVLPKCPENAETSKCITKLLIDIRINPLGEEFEKNLTVVIIDEIYNARTNNEQKLISPYVIEIQKAKSVLMYQLQYSWTIQCDECHTKTYREFENENKEQPNEEKRELFYQKRVGHVLNSDDPDKNRSHFGSFHFRPKIESNEIKNTNKMGIIKGVQKNKLPPIRKLPQHPVLRELSELEASNKFNGDSPFENPFTFYSGKHGIMHFKRGNVNNLQLEQNENKKANERLSSLRKHEIYDINNPVPFLITKMRIFQERENKWLKIGPTVALSSLSGNFNENANISITLSSSDKLFPSSKRYDVTRFENCQLLVPFHISHSLLRSNKRYSVISPEDSFLIFNSNKLKKCIKKLDNEESSTLKVIKRLCDLSVCKGRMKVYHVEGDMTEEDFIEMKNKQHIQQQFNSILDNDDNITESVNKLSNLEIFTLDEYKNFRDEEEDIDILEKCKHNKKYLCLNLLYDKLPAYSIKIQFPLHENALISNNDYYRVRITDIVTDATTSSILQVTTNVINVGFIAHEFTICIDNCLKGMHIKNVTVIKKLLLPKTEENVEFILNSTEVKRFKEISCEISVKLINSRNQNDMKTIAKRKFIIKPLMRCFCIWNCNCKCKKKDAKLPNKFNCDKMDKPSALQAGFTHYEEVNKISYIACIWIILILIFVMALILGLLKAVLGLCSPKVRTFGYNFIQPGRFYDSKTRYFFINIIFFICIPFACCCCRRKRKPELDEEKLLLRDYWELEIIQHKICETSDDDDDQNNEDGKNNDVSKKRLLGGTTDDDEETILSRRIEKCNFREEILPNQAFNLNHSSVMKTERRQSLCELNAPDFNMQSSHYVDNDDINDSDLEDKEAALFVKQLIDGKIVYRIFYHPIGNIDTEEFQQYSIRGYFIIDTGKGYKFITPIPTRQYFRICAKDRTLTMIQTPLLLNSKALSRNYRNRKDVFRQGDLSLEEPYEAPCINYLPRGINSITTDCTNF